MFQRTYKFRLCPSGVQVQGLVQVQEGCRWLFNHMLQRKNEGWTYPMIQAEIPKLVKERPFLDEVHSKTRQYILWQLKANIRALGGLKKRGRKVGSIRFRGKGRFKTFVYNQSGFKVEGKRLHLSKIGDIPMKQHREIRGVVKQVIIKRTETNKWFAMFCVEQDCDVRTLSEKRVGIDLGINHYAVDSDGGMVEHPHVLNKRLKKLAREQRRFCRKVKGSNNRRKQRYKVARIHERVTDARMDFLHKLSTRYVCEYGFIAVEDLDVKGMVEGEKYNARNKLDSSWSTFIGLLDYKAESAGVQLVKVDPKNTSQDCSGCGQRVYKPLWVRTHNCPHCGVVLDRDYNAALNILRKAQKEIGLGCTEYTPAETQPLLEVQRDLGQAASMKQEAPCESGG
jgi:putative transposase